MRILLTYPLTSMPSDIGEIMVRGKYCQKTFSSHTHYWSNFLIPISVAVGWHCLPVISLLNHEEIYLGSTTIYTHLSQSIRVTYIIYAFAITVKFLLFFCCFSETTTWSRAVTYDQVNFMVIFHVISRIVSLWHIILHRLKLLVCNSSTAVTSWSEENE